MRQPVPFGKYLLLDRISVGGMAEVFKAKSYGVEGFEKVIAIKRILPSMGEDKDFIKMFIDEAKIAGQLSHANICQIFEFGKHQGAHFIAMEYVWGKDLLQIQNRLRKLDQVMPVTMACHIIAKVCEGLDYAHRKRDPMGRPLEIVHRDCSPQNILLSYEGEVKIIDFGIARAASRSSRTNAGVLKGKFGYMSPEQVRGLPLDNRSDLFAVGTVFYESLTGERLFQGESDFSTLERVRNAEVRPPSEVNRNVPPEVEKIVMRALSRNREERYASGAEMHADLQAFLTAQEVPFTGKSLADWLKQAFNEELSRERAMMEEYRRVGRDGLIAGAPQASARVDLVRELGEAGAPDGDPTALGPPDLDALADVAAGAGARPARGKVVRSGERAEDWEDDGPTEIFGEIGGDGGGEESPEESGEESGEDRRSPADRGAGRAQTDRGPARAGTPPPSLSVSLSESARVEGGPGRPPQPTPPPIVATPTGMRPLRPVASGPGAPAGPVGFPPFDPERSTPGMASGYSPYPSIDGYPSTTGAAPAPRPRRRGRSSAGRDIAIGCAIAALVLAAFVSAKFLVFGEAPRAESAAAATSTIAVMADGSEPAEVSLDGERVGVVRGDAPLTLSSVQPGERVVRVTRAGAPPCERRIEARPDKIELVRCALGAPPVPTTGTLVLAGVGPQHRVFVNDQEITAEAAGEPVVLAAGVAHSVVVKSGEKVVQELQVTVEPGQEVRRDIPAVAVRSGPPRDPPPPEQAPRETPEPRSARPPEPRSAKPIDEPRTPERVARPTERGGTAPQRGGSSGGSAAPKKVSTTSSQPGTFTAFTKPWARVHIDGVDTGKMTPIAPRSAITLPPGPHKVTFVVGDQKFDYKVVIEPGKRKNLVKVLPVK